MLFSAWIILGFVGAVLATPRQGTDVLTISLQGPAASVASIDDIKLTARVTNTGSDTVKVLKYGTILDADNPTRSFVVTKNGTDVQFTGVQPMIYLEYLDDSAFVVIPPGQAVTVVHSVAPLYDFAAAGPGLFTFEPVTSFQLVTAANQTHRPSFLKATASESIVVEVTEDVATRHLVGEGKRAVNICRDLQRRAFISASYVEAKILARQAIDYITIRGAGDPLYRSYWGNNDVNVVRNVFSLVELENSTTRTVVMPSTFAFETTGLLIPNSLPPTSSIVTFSICKCLPIDFVLTRRSSAATSVEVPPFMRSHTLSLAPPTSYTGVFKINI